MTELYLDITPNNSCKSFLIKDSSLYNPNLPITCCQLEVSAPGFTFSHTFEVLPKFEVLVNMGNLGISHGNILPLLPDGNYCIKYSINPNDKLFVEYNYFSICQLWEEYIEASCEALKTENPISLKTIEKLFEVSNLLEYTKYAAEYCGNVEQAKILYKQAQRKLKEVNDGCKTCM